MNDHSNRVRAWRCRLAQYWKPSEFTFEKVCEKFACNYTTYCLLRPAFEYLNDSKAPIFQLDCLTYVGSTVTSANKRQDARIRKFKQLQKNQPVSSELCLHWFHSRGCIHEFVIIPLHACNSLLQCRTLEACCIQKWVPKLNFPFVMKLLPTKKKTGMSKAVHQISTIYKMPASRLFRKLRKRLFGQMKLRIYSDDLFQNDTNWCILFRLAKSDSTSFKQSKELRTCKFSIDQLYALLRLANSLEDPPRSKVRKLIKNAISFRNGPIPTAAKPLVIPLLAHKHFKVQAKRWLRKIVMSRKDQLIPFHLPCCSIVAGKFPSVSTTLYSHFQWMRKFVWESPPICSCSDLRRKHPELAVVTIDGREHIASEASKMQFSRRIKFWLSVNAKTQVYPDFEDYVRMTWNAISKWLKHNKLGGVSSQDWKAFLEQQWVLHYPEARVPLSMQDIHFLRSELQQLVVHGRDHAAQHVHVFCPWLYHHVLTQTFADKQVYNHLNMTPTAAAEHLRTFCHSKLAKKYRWGVDSAASVPNSYILLKAKKNFLKARPIISYRAFHFAKLFRCTSFVLLTMQNEVFPDSFGLKTMPEMFQELHSFLRTTPVEEFILQSNQDLIGFFTSIPAERILASVQTMVAKYKEMYPNKQSHVFTIFPREKDVKLRVFRGKKKALSGRAYTIDVTDLAALCRMSLETSVFTQMGQVFQQVRGSAIGNQISPVLASVAVAHTEQTWIDTNRAKIAGFLSQIYINRYVDNRLVLYPEHLHEHTWLRQLLQLDFYNTPVELETVPDGEFLGTTLCEASRVVKLLLPSALHFFRPLNSAGCDEHKFAAANSRICMAARFSFPESQRQADVQEVVNLYSSRGYPISQIRRIASRFLT